MGTITKIHESVFPLPIREDLVRRQLIEMGDDCLTAKKSKRTWTPVKKDSFFDFKSRQYRRQLDAARLTK